MKGVGFDSQADIWICDAWKGVCGTGEVDRDWFVAMFYLRWAELLYFILASLCGIFWMREFTRWEGR